MFVVMEKVNAQKIFWAIAHAEVKIQGTFHRLALGSGEIFDFVFCGGVLHGEISRWLDLEGAAIFFGAAGEQFLPRDALVAAGPIVSGQKIQGITDLLLITSIFLIQNPTQH